MKTILDSLTAIGGSLATWWLWMTLMTAALALVALLADRALARRVAARWRMLLHASVLLRVLVPLGVGIAVPLPFMAREAVQPAIAPAVWHLDSAASVADSALQASVPDGAPVRTSPLALVPIGYGAGVLWLVARWARDRRRLRALVAASVPCDDRAEPAFAVASHPTVGPLLVGSVRPTLLLPDRLLAADSQGALEHVLAHERAHCRRFDPILATLVHALVIAAWPIVPVWFAAARLRTLMELAADEAAVEHFDDERRRQYGRTLVDCASTLQPARASLAFASAIRERVHALRGAPRRGLRQASLALAAAALLVACASVRPGPFGTTATESAASTEGPPIVLSFRVLELPPNSPLLEPQDSGERATVAVLPTAALAAVERADGTTVMAAPRILANRGEPARVSVGSVGDDGTLLDGFTIDATVTRVASAAAGTGDTVELRLSYSERRSDARTWQSGPLTIVVGPDAASAVVVRSADAGGQRAIVVAAKPQEAAFDPMGGDYPQISWMVNVFEMPTQPEVRPDGTVVVAAGPKSNGVAVFEAGRIDAIFDSVRAIPGARLVAVPALMTKPGAKASISSSDRDKAGSTIGERTITLEGTPVDGGGVRTTSDVSLHAAEFGASANVGQRVIPAGGGLVYVGPGPRASDPWTVIVLRPTVLRGIEDYPFQTEGSSSTK
ncbi:MAG: M56 family metallopeptidase [Phycisphaerae bacterium]|nr:M56 family metallopeptidase [Phycisphaerae bacterium]